MHRERSLLQGPNELFAAIIEYRDGGSKAIVGARGGISNDGLRRLMLLAYYASQTVEEGRYPTFRMYVPPAGYPGVGADPWEVLRFRQPVPLGDVEDLRRLAPSAASHDFALKVEEQVIPDAEPTLMCVGIVLAHSGAATAEVFSPTIWTTAMRPGLMIRVDGPGAIRVSEGPHGFDLRAGRLTRLGSHSTHPAQRWEDDLIRKDARTDRERSCLTHLVDYGWNELLGLASQGGRGGCLIVLPISESDPQQIAATYDIELKYPTDGPELGRALVEFMAICDPPNTLPMGADLKAAANDWMRKRRDLDSLLRSLAHLSGVDGCTVFDRDVRLLGFGGKLHAPSADSARQFTDFESGQPLNRDLLIRTGTRHLSAFRLCDHNARVSAYVVSQDGDVTLFWSDQERVYRWKPYWPWAKQSGQR
jgi:hypothetical protein